MTTLIDAQRRAFNALKRSRSVIASKQYLKLERPDIRKLEFIIPRGTETISRLEVSRSKTTSMSEEISHKFYVSLEFSSPNESTRMPYADFIINSITEPIVFKGQPFPYFMFPEYTFYITIRPCGKVTEIPTEILADYDIIAETIIRDREVVSEKSIKLSEVCDQPWKYRFRCDQLIKTYEYSCKAECCNTNEIKTRDVNKIDKNFVEMTKEINLMTEVLNAISKTSGNIEIFKMQKNPEKPEETITPQVPKEYKTLDIEISSLDGLISLIDTGLTGEFEYAIDIARLTKARPGLEKLRDTIGMNKIKTTMSEWIMYFLSDLPRSGNGQFMNIALLGEPGVGKTHVSEILAEIFASLSVTKTGTLAKVSITDLVGQYTGQSENKTADLLKKYKGCVILVDEAYAIARSGDSRVCSFGSKSLDTINKFLGENTDTMMIICGYKDLINKYFFGVNDGLKRRFPWTFEMTGYSESELFEILKNKAGRDGYRVEFTQDESNEFIGMLKNNSTVLKHAGGDMANIITKSISWHCKKILSVPKNEKNKINFETIKHGLKTYLEDSKKPEEADDKNYRTMFL